ncbi:MAG: restriction endonuclease subunit S [Treponema sp.]|nr:restriction endonuclease subunit S [Treponema sp.]
MSAKYKKLGEIVELIDERNKDGKVQNLIGVSIDKCFIKSVANTIGTDLTKYQVIRKNDFACSLMQVSRDGKIPIACLKDYDEAIMSPAYYIFRIKNTNEVLPDYLAMWFMRTEFDREASYIAVGGVRGSMPWEDFCDMKLPVPDLKEQKKIVNTYNAITKRIQLKQKINENLEKTAESIYKNSLTTKKTSISSLGKECNITTGKLNSEDATIDGEYPFFTCSQETYKTNTFAFDQEAVLLAGNNASAIYPLKIYKGKFNAYQRTYVISSNNHLISNYQIYFDLKNKLEEFKGVSFGTTTKFLTMTILNPIEIHIFSEKDSYELTTQLKVCFDEITINQKELVELNDLKQLVISRISGM